MLLSIELSRLRIESFFCLFIPFLPYHGKLGRNPCDGSRVVSNILRIPRKIHCCHCYLVVKRGTNSLKKSTVPCPRGLRALAFRIPLRFQDSNASGVARWDIRFTNRRPISTESSSIWPSLSRFATGIVETPWRRLSFTGKTRYSFH